MTPKRDLTSHTPEPWKAEWAMEWRVVGDYLVPTTSVQGTEIKREPWIADVDTEADARLIAAAPGVVGGIGTAAREWR